MDYLNTILKNFKFNYFKSQEVLEHFVFLNKVLYKIFYKKKNTLHKSILIGSYSRNTNIDLKNINILFDMPVSILESDLAILPFIDNSKDEFNNKYTINLSKNGKFFEFSTNQDMSFRILPAFSNIDGSFTFRISQHGDLWSVMNPLLENNEFKTFYLKYKNAPIQLSKLVRLWAISYNVDFSGYLIDTLVYHFYKQYDISDIVNMKIDTVFKLFMVFMNKQEKSKYFWKSPGIGHIVPKTDNFHDKSKETLELIESNSKNAYETIFNLEKLGIEH